MTSSRNELGSAVHGPARASPQCRSHIPKMAIEYASCMNGKIGFENAPGAKLPESLQGRAVGYTPEDIATGGEGVSTEIAKCSAFYWAKTDTVRLSSVWAEQAVSQIHRFGLPIREIGFTAILRGEELRFEDDPASLARLASVMPTCTTVAWGSHARRSDDLSVFLRWDACAFIHLSTRYSFLGVTDADPIVLSELAEFHLAILRPIVNPAYGISYTHPLWLAPRSYAGGTLSGRIASDYSDLGTAYADPVNQWGIDHSGKQKWLRGWFRDVYPVQLLNPEHVSTRLQDGRSFMDSGIGKLTPCGEDRWWWSVDESELSAARHMLVAASRLLCPPRAPTRSHIPKDLLS